MPFVIFDENRTVPYRVEEPIICLLGDCLLGNIASFFVGKTSLKKNYERIVKTFQLITPFRTLNEGFDQLVRTQYLRILFIFLYFRLDEQENEFSIHLAQSLRVVMS